MNEFLQWLEPAAEWVPGLRSGKYTIDQAANRVRDAASGRYIGALIPSDGLMSEVTSLPRTPVMAHQILTQSASLAHVAPALESLQLISTAGALASVASLAVSIAGFSFVLRGLSRLEGRLDELLSRVELLGEAVRQVQIDRAALSVARLLAAAECLNRAVACDGAVERAELARRARGLFQEARLFHLQLWCSVDPWKNPALEIETCLEMQGRYVACAIGEIHAEFLLEDAGALRHAAASSAQALHRQMHLEKVEAFRVRSDAACSAGVNGMAHFQALMPTLVSQIDAAFDITRVSQERLANQSFNADLPEFLGMPAFQIARVARAATGVDLYLLRPEGVETPSRKGST